MAEKTTIARPYAQAVFAIAQEQGDLAGWSAMLEFAAVVAAAPEMVALVDSPNVGADKKVDLFLDVCGDKLTDAGKNFVRVVAENGRMKLLPEIAALYEVERAAAESTVEAEVVSAAELSKAQQKAIITALKARLNRDVTLSCSVDESIVGGAIIRAGDVVIDGSVVSKLDKLSHQLLH